MIDTPKPFLEPETQGEQYHMLVPVPKWASLVAKEAEERRRRMTAEAKQRAEYLATVDLSAYR